MTSLLYGKVLENHFYLQFDDIHIPNMDYCKDCNVGYITLKTESHKHFEDVDFFDMCPSCSEINMIVVQDENL